MLADRVTDFNDQFFFSAGPRDEEAQGCGGFQEVNAGPWLYSALYRYAHLVQSRRISFRVCSYVHLNISSVTGC